MADVDPFDLTCRPLAWRLPPDAGAAAVARSLVASGLSALALPAEQIDNGKIAVSEVVTNAFRHARRAHGGAPVVAPELRLWVRTAPSLQLIVSVFDGDRDHLPRPACGDLLDEAGKGLAIVAAITAGWGAHLSRYRCGSSLAPGKAVWFALSLHDRRPRGDLTVLPSGAAHRLRVTLRERGLAAVQADASHIIAISTATGRPLRIEAAPGGFTWRNEDGHPVRHPLIDIEDTAEHVVNTVEQIAHSAWPDPPTPEPKTMLKPALPTARAGAPHIDDVPGQGPDPQGSGTTRVPSPASAPPPDRRQGGLHERDREALRLARDLRTRIAEWLHLRGVDSQPVISPFVDPQGRPNVLIRLDSHAARTMVLSLIEVSVAQHDRRHDDGPHDHP